MNSGEHPRGFPWRPIMLVRDHMTSNLTTLSDDARLIDAALLIRRTGKRHVPIIATGTGELVGIVSDRDILRAAPSALNSNEDEYNELFEQTPVTVAMTRSPLTIRPDAPVIEAVQQLYAKKISSILVADETGLKGILTVTDMLGLLNEMLGSHGEKPLAAGN
jgi:CBS domain-containing protein